MTPHPPVALAPLLGQNPVLKYMVENNLPLTVETYKGLNWLGDPMPDELDEEEQETITALEAHEAAPHTGSRAAAR